VVGSLITAAVLVLLLAGRHDEFTAALSSAAAGVIAVTAALQIVALVRAERGVGSHDRGGRRCGRPPDPLLRRPLEGDPDLGPLLEG
jgi:hypothetical protein